METHQEEQKATHKLNVTDEREWLMRAPQSTFALANCQSVRSNRLQHSEFSLGKEA